MSNQGLSQKSCTLAAPAVLASHGATPLPDGGGIEYQGWTFRTSHSTISGEQDLIGIAGRLATACGAPIPPDDVIVINNAHLHLPAMIFGTNDLEIVNAPTGLKFEFKAEDSLHSWAVQHSTPGGLSHVPQVPYAAKWMRQASSDPAAGVADAAVTGAISSINGSDNNASSSPREALVVEGVPEPIVPEHWDWTFSSEYCCSVRHRDGDSVVVGASDVSNTPQGELAGFKPVGASGINVDMLKQQHDILLYDEIGLFQDDLQDCGDVSLEVKIRVMPTCWFVLCRFFKRVDGSMACIRDSRLFHEFGSSRVYMDLLWQEQNIPPSPTASEAGEGCAPRDGMSRFSPLASTASAVATAHPLAAMRPQQAGQHGALPTLPPNQQRDANAWSRILPDVTRKNKIHKNFELDLSV